MALFQGPRGVVRAAGVLAKALDKDPAYTRLEAEKPTEKADDTKRASATTRKEG